MKKPNILFVLPYCPWPLLTGGHQAIFNGILAAIDYANIFITYQISSTQDNKKEILLLENELEKKAKIIPYIYKDKNNIKKTIRKHLGRVKKIFIKSNNDKYFNKYLTTSLHDNQYYEYINNLIVKNSIDIVQLEMNENLDFVLTLPSTVKKVFIHHELRFVRNELAIKETNTKNYYREALVKIEKFKEIQLLNLCDYVITLSENDKKKLEQEFIKTPIHASFAVVKSSNSEKQILKEEYTLSFVGPEMHNPNKIGLIWFLENCWYTLKKKSPHFKLKIIGKWSKETEIELKKKYQDIYFLGYVPNLVQALNNSTMIVPITIGSGIRMKILEAMSNKIPFVSTTIGAEGIPVINEKNCYLADIPSEFVNSIIKLQDVNIKKKFTESSYKIIDEKYSINALKNDRINIYNKLLNI